MKTKELIDALRICADDDIICPACERYETMGIWGGTAKCHEDLMLKAAEELERLDAVEVVHGRWIRRGNEMKCSKCQFIYYSNHDDFNYCPNCGAKMDGDGNG